MKKILGLIIAFFVFSILFAPGVWAADLNVECFGTGTCSKTGLDPLFSKSIDGYWLPGINLTKTINLKNSSSEIKEVAIKATRTSLTGILEDVMMVNLSPAGGVNIFSGSLADFYSLDNISLGNLDPGQNKDFNFVVNMEASAGNEYQGRETGFDLTLGFWANEAAPTPTPTPSGGSGGVVSGSSTGTGGGGASCNDGQPGVPINLSVIAGPGPDQATLSWVGVAPFTGFLIAYSDTPDSPKWGNPDVGNVSSYIVSGLPNGTYYFWVRGQNGCMPGNFAGPASVIVSISAAMGTATGFEPGVLGEATPSGQIQEQEAGGEVAGIKAGVCQRCIWWPLLLGELVILVIYYQLILKKQGSRRNYLLLVTIPIIVYLIFLFLNRNCFSNSFFCRYFWLLDLGLFVISIGIVKWILITKK